jgi:hypothetical protein
MISGDDFVSPPFTSINLVAKSKRRFQSPLIIVEIFIATIKLILDDNFVSHLKHNLQWRHIYNDDICYHHVSKLQRILMSPLLIKKRQVF